MQPNTCQVEYYAAIQSDDRATGANVAMTLSTVETPSLVSRAPDLSLWKRSLWQAFSRKPSPLAAL